MRRLAEQTAPGAWVALEKIHGANFGLVCTATDVYLQRRNALLEDGESFFYAPTSPLVQELKGKVRALWGMLPPVTTLVVFGELFGSNVQQEIFYSAHLQFACFDVALDGVLVPYDELVALCGRAQIPHVPCLSKAPLPELIAALEPGLETLVSRYHPAAIAEGIVLRPLSGAGHPINERRPMLKLKRALFSERKAPGRAAAATADAEAVEQARAFITPGRLAAVRSKLAEDALFFDVAKALAADALDEIEWLAGLDEGDEDAAVFWSLASDALKKRMRKAVTDAAFILTKQV